MKVRYLGTLLLAVLTFFGCDDNTGTLGLGMLPDSDRMSAHTTTFDVITRSFPCSYITLPINLPIDSRTAPLL